MLSYQVEVRASYLFASVRGEITIDSAISTFGKIMQAAVAQRQPRLLIDCTGMTGDWTPKSRYTFGEFVALEQQRLAGHFSELPRVAIYAVPPIYDASRFTQIVANNRGARLRASDTLQELLSWLES
jgi:hypothetical protein